MAEKSCQNPAGKLKIIPCHFTNFLGRKKLLFVNVNLCSYVMLCRARAVQTAVKLKICCTVAVLLSVHSYQIWQFPAKVAMIHYTVGNIFPLDPDLAQRIQNLALTIHFYWVWTLKIILALPCQFLDWQWSKLLDKGSNNRIPN